MVERGVKREQQQGGGEGGDLFLPPGFRFHPTDEEVITSYLLQKFLNPSFSPRAMGEVNLNKCEPWDLPSKAKMGEKEWYFFCHKDMKYPTGMRTNRATEKGYWKATGKDREIFKPSSPSEGRELVGMKKTLVFYMGRAPRGSKTNWVMHEFRLDGKYGTSDANNQRLRSRDEWVVCKVFHKNTDAEEKKAADAIITAEYSPVVGTPNVSSISVDATADVVDDGAADDGFFNSMIDDPVSFFNSSTNLPDFSAAGYPAAASTAATATMPAGSFVADLLQPSSYTFGDATTGRNNLNHHQALIAANSTSAAPNLTSSSRYDVSSSLFPWNLPQQNPMGGSSSYNLHDQLAMMARALGGGGGVSPNFAAASLPTATGISQNISPLRRGGYGTNYYSGSNSSAAAGQNAKNLGA